MSGSSPTATKPKTPERPLARPTSSSPNTSSQSANAFRQLAALQTALSRGLALQPCRLGPWPSRGKELGGASIRDGEWAAAEGHGTGRPVGRASWRPDVSVVEPRLDDRLSALKPVHALRDGEGMTEGIAEYTREVNWRCLSHAAAAHSSRQHLRRVDLR